MRSAAAGLYVHIPFCTARCHYCDFVVKPLQPSQVKKYWQSLEQEIRLAAPRWSDVPFSSIFFGGGTPSAVPAEELIELLHLLRDRFHVEQDAEITMEANPESLTLEQLQKLRSAGINRLSIGLQTWQDDLLARLGRRHRRDDFLRSYHQARQAGFTNINVDLMYGLPGQTLEAWRETLREVTLLMPEHISAYCLQIEEGTAFDRWVRQGTLTLPDEELQVEMIYETRHSLQKAGYEHYELSNYSLPGKASRHNLVYWLHRPYLGLGPGAYSYRGGLRWWNVDLLRLYHGRLAEGRLPLAGEEHLGRSEQMTEYVFLHLRLVRQGLSEDEFQERFDISLDRAFPNIAQRLQQDGWLRREGRRLLLTEKALPLANWVCAHFVSLTTQ